VTPGGDRLGRVVRLWRAHDAESLERSSSVAPIASVIAALIVAAFVAVGLRDATPLRPGEARLLLRGAVVDVAYSGHPFARIRQTVTLHPGDRVRARSGSPELQFAHDTSAELRRDSAVRIGGSNVSLSLERGDVLAHGPIEIGSPEGTAHVAGLAKLSERSGLTAGAYSGSIAVKPVDAASQTVPRYRQIVVLGLGSAPSDAVPLHVDDSDAWDRRILGDVLDLDNRLESFARGLDAQLPAGSGVTPGFYRAMIPALGRDDIPAPLLTARSAGENVIGFTLVSLDHGAFADRLAHVFGFRDQGARWGLVAADRGLHPPDVLTQFQAALGRAPVGAAIPLSRSSSTRNPGETTRPTTPTTNGPSTTGPPTTQPPPGVLPPITTGIPPVDNATQGIENILTALINGIIPPPPPGRGSGSSAPTTTTLPGRLLG